MKTTFILILGAIIVVMFAGCQVVGQTGITGIQKEGNIVSIQFLPGANPKNVTFVDETTDYRASMKNIGNNTYQVCYQNNNPWHIEVWYSDGGHAIYSK